MGRSPATVGGIVFQNPVVAGAVISFADVAEENALIGFAAYGKANGVPKVLSGMPRAFAGIAQIAGLVQLLRAGKLAFVAGSRAVTFPPASQWKAGTMKPGAVLIPMGRHKKRACQNLRSLFG
jgi:hypothetical protein